MLALWDMAPSSLAEIYRRFRGASSIFGDPEISANIYEATARSILETVIFILAAVRT
jgi:hypothetical protein